jgi:hypothetical protein
MALIRFLSPVGSIARSFTRGDEAEFNETEAAALVANGFAEFVEIEPEEPESPEMRAIRLEAEHEPQAAKKTRGKGKKQ